MHFSALLLSVSLASAQYAHHQFGPGPAELEYLKNINEGPNQNQAQNQAQNHNGNGNYGNYEVGYDDHQNAVPSPHTPIRAPASSATPTIHSTFIVRASQVPAAPSHAKAPAPGYAYNHPSPSPQGRSQGFGPDDHDIPAGASGGMAPIDPMRPGSQVAPPPLFPDQNHGKDEGNSFCMGKCFANESDAKCAKPYAMAIYKPKKGCYMCCITSDF
ncbi:hypothetical protein N7489_011080 [Penicillium chrysogenum]|uniref:Uncharacterized protein n=1 Tax=Penicillium chrysogenum TaxID=5076 RepID=A0ABQ8WC47_PENCH|nr:uncharacterized protein N7489_011080 [Penicillium chrysogenum]KAJ5230372.1 hypothetical protein N7489_011080 [Penicillium chrysogenum]KAJ5264216.1 hypothetical protein N7505_008137 [Penicillium chrysogenum]KAJ5272047.1 hypothetical protein N7524_005316 [Penicillium chrysogenum]KAJ6163398.1 hypothetical protein N7497_003377 [Penicillium chrysogenum]